MFLQALHLRRSGLLLIVLVTLAFSGRAQKQIALGSHNGKITFEFQAGKGCCSYDVSYDGKKLIANSEMRLIFKSGAFKNAKVLKP